MSRTSTRGIAAAALIGALALPLAACGGGEVAGVGASMTSPPREASGDGGSSSPVPDELEELLPDDLEQALPEDLPEDLLPEDLPDMGEMQDCFDVATAYAGLAFSAIGGPEAAAKARETAEDLKPRLPEDLHDDIDVVADAYAGIAEDGFLDGAGALDDPAFAEANANIEAYLQEACAGG